VADEDRSDVLQRERSLLYVAATRARDELVVMYSGEPSALLP
jgi:superfamily I DNA/RNA helicase